MTIRLLNVADRGRSWRGGASAIVMVAAALALNGCNDHEQQSSPPPKTVTVTQPKAADVTRYLYETGTTKALQSVDLTARVSGYLRAVDYQDGSEVKAGQRLFLIEPDQYQAQVDQYQAAVEQAQASLSNAQVQLDRQQDLMKSSTTTQANVDNARATRDENQAQLDSSKASLKQAQLNLGYTSVTAPFDGFVTEHQADVGALVGNGTPTTLATIVKMDPIHVSFSISDTDMLQIRKQIRERGRSPKDVRSVAIEAATNVDAGFPLKGTLDYVAPQTDANTGTLAVRAVFDNKSRDLLPNLFVRLRIPVATVKDALLVPPAAVGTDQQGRYILIVNDKGVVERRSVDVLERSGDLQQIKGSVGPSDWVVDNVIVGVRPGETVRKQQVSPSAQDEMKQPDASTPAKN